MAEEQHGRIGAALDRLGDRHPQPRRQGEREIRVVGGKAVHRAGEARRPAAGQAQIAVAAGAGAVRNRHQGRLAAVLGMAVDA